MKSQALSDTFSSGFFWTKPARALRETPAIKRRVWDCAGVLSLRGRYRLIHPSLLNSAPHGARNGILPPPLPFGELACVKNCKAALSSVFPFSFLLSVLCARAGLVPNSDIKRRRNSSVSHRGKLLFTGQAEGEKGTRAKQDPFGGHAMRSRGGDLLPSVCVWGGRKGVVETKCGSQSTLGRWKHKHRLIITALNTQTHMALIRQVLFFRICAPSLLFLPPLTPLL